MMLTIYGSRNDKSLGIVRVQTGITILEKSQKIDWLAASKDQRAQLYVILRAISDLTGQSIETCMEEALGYKLLVGADYLRNFRRGAIARSKAKLIAVWIGKHLFDTAHTIAPDLFPKVEMKNWNDLIPKIGNKDRLRIVRIQKDAGILQRSDEERLIGETIKLNEEFYFELDSAKDGFAVAYQGYRGEWHPLPLGTNPHDLIVLITKGEQILPRHPNNKPIELSEKEDLGTHQFAIFVAQHANDLPDQANGVIDQCTVHLNQVAVTLDS